MMRSYLVVLLFIFSFTAQSLWAGGFDLSAGMGWAQTEIENEDGTSAKHSGLAFQVQGTYLFYNKSQFQLGLNLKGKYLDTSNNSAGDETAEGLLYGAGLELKMGSFIFDASYMIGEPTYTFSANTESRDIETTAFNYSISYKHEVATNKYFVFTYAGADGSVDGSSLGVTEDLNYKENILWVSFRIEASPESNYRKRSRSPKAKVKRAPVRSKYFFDGYSSKK